HVQDFVPPASGKQTRAFSIATYASSDMDGSHAFDFPLADLSPGQQAALDAALSRERIENHWTGTTLHVDIAYEARVSTLIAQARGGALPPAPVAAAAPPGSAPTAPLVTPTEVLPPGQMPLPGSPYAGPTPYGAPGYVPGTYGYAGPYYQS